MGLQRGTTSRHHKDAARLFFLGYNEKSPNVSELSGQDFHEVIRKFVAGIVDNEAGTLMNNTVLEKSAAIIRMVLNSASKNLPWSPEEATRAAAIISLEQGNIDKITALMLLVTEGVNPCPTTNDRLDTEPVIPGLT